jgi:hypothetical protein
MVRTNRAVVSTPPAGRGRSLVGDVAGAIARRVGLLLVMAVFLFGTALLLLGRGLPIPVSEPADEVDCGDDVVRDTDYGRGLADEGRLEVCCGLGAGPLSR